MDFDRAEHVVALPKGEETVIETIADLRSQVEQVCFALSLNVQSLNTALIAPGSIIVISPGSSRKTNGQEIGYCQTTQNGSRICQGDSHNLKS